MFATPATKYDLSLESGKPLVEQVKRNHTAGRLLPHGSVTVIRSPISRRFARNTWLELLAEAL
jgi:hypothetical protein